MLSSIAKVLKVLNSEAEPSQISLALCFSMVAGLPPFFSLHNVLVFLVVFLLRVNLSMFFLGTVFFPGLAYLLDPLFDRIGFALLTAGALNGLWTEMYNNTIWRLMKFNNSVVMGSFVFSLFAFLPLFLLANLAIRRYREHVLAWVKKTRIMRAFMASRLYELYRKASGWGTQS